MRFFPNEAYEKAIHRLPPLPPLENPNPRSPIPVRRSLGEVGTNIQYPISNIQYPISNIQSNPTLAVCLDADRLDLGRVGITPDPEYLSTLTAKSIATRQAWHELED
jgi:hypothetical protein